jgi:hypothetical protein
MRGVIATFVVTSVSGCFFFEGGGGSNLCGDDTPDPRLAERVIAPDHPPEPLRDPESLTCEPVGGCGQGPSWASCSTACDALDEATCALQAECRVVRDVRCAVDGTCETDFMGCFPTDRLPDPAVDCLRATDGETCSRSAECTAFHCNERCPDPPCPRPFALCMPEGAAPGRCFDPVACRALPPPCPSGTVPGVVDLCFSGACIPNDLCEPAPL